MKGLEDRRVIDTLIKADVFADLMLWNIIVRFSMLPREEGRNRGFQLIHCRHQSLSFGDVFSCASHKLIIRGTRACFDFFWAHNNQVSQSRKRA